MRTLAIIFVAFGLFIGWSQSRPGLSAADHADIDAAMTIAQSERAVRALLKDPKSAEFSGMMVMPNGLLVCGYVRAKNSFGGYAGRKEFLTVGKLVVINDGSEDFKTQWNQSCLKKT